MLAAKHENFRPILSLVVVTYSNPDELCRTLLSCGGLPSYEFEIIVIDGSPGSECGAAVREAEIPVHQYVHEPDDGIYDAMNKGISRAGGRGVLMLNSGDMLDDAARFGRAILGIQDLVETHVIFGDTVDDFNGDRVSRKKIRTVGPDEIRRGELPSHQSIVLPTWFSKEHPYDARLGMAADTACLRNAFASLPARRLDEVIAVFSYGGRSNAAPPASKIMHRYREYVAARDLTWWERAQLLLRLAARSILGNAIGGTAHKRFQAGLARRRAGKPS